MWDQQGLRAMHVAAYAEIFETKVFSFESEMKNRVY